MQEYLITAVASWQVQVQSLLGWSRQADEPRPGRRLSHSQLQTQQLLVSHHNNTFIRSFVY